MRGTWACCFDDRRSYLLYFSDTIVIYLYNMFESHASIMNVVIILREFADLLADTSMLIYVSSDLQIAC